MKNNVKTIRENKLATYKPKPFPNGRLGETLENITSKLATYKPYKKKVEEKFMKNNVKTVKTNKPSKLATYRKAIITSSSVAMLVATSTISVAAAPEGVDVSSMSTVTDVIFWIARVVIGACTLLPGLINIAKGHSNEDDRMRNGGIATCVVGVACIGALEVIKGVAFS